MANPADNWDWPFMVYIGRVLLRYNTNEFWALTPRQLSAQIQVHGTIEQQKYAKPGKHKGAMAKPGFIDNIPGW